MTDYKQIESAIAEKLQAMGFEIESQLTADDYDYSSREGRMGQSHWRVLVSVGGRKKAFDYHMGAAYREFAKQIFRDGSQADDAWWRGRTKPISEATLAIHHKHSRPTQPKLVDVMYSLTSDAQCVQNVDTFEEFAAELGYDEDSRKAEAAYRACLETYAWLSSVCDFDALCELFQDY